MCYNSQTSFGFFLLGIFSATYIYNYIPKLRKTQIHLLFLFYSAMELLQSIQYFYVNQCDNIMNIITTEIAYLLVIVQPLIWNIFFYINSDNCEKYIFYTAISMCLLWISVNVFSRLMYKKINKPQTQEHSVFASNKVCTRKLNSHLFWTWTSANLYELNANFFSYSMLWILPALISKSNFQYGLILIFGSIIGSLYGYTYDISEIYYTFTASWCFISVPNVFFCFLKLLYNNNIIL